MAGFDDAEMDFDNIMDEVGGDDVWMDHMDMMEDGPPQESFMHPPGEDDECHGFGSVEIDAGGGRGNMLETLSSIREHGLLDDGSARQCEDNEHAVALTAQNDRPVLPVMTSNEVTSSTPHGSFASSAQGFQRRRITGKQGVGTAYSDSLAALRMRRLGTVDAYANLSKSKRLCAQNYVRVHLWRNMKKNKNGECVTLKHGIVLQCRTKQEYVDRSFEIRKKLLYDLAHTCGLPEGVSGCAVTRWMSEVGEIAKITPAVGRPRAEGQYYILSNMSLVTCHGDFGVSQLTQQPPHVYCRIVGNSVQAATRNCICVGCIEQQTPVC